MQKSCWQDCAGQCEWHNDKEQLQRFGGGLKVVFVFIFIRLTPSPVPHRSQFCVTTVCLGLERKRMQLDGGRIFVSAFDASSQFGLTWWEQSLMQCSVLIGGYVDDEMANLIGAHLLYLDSMDSSKYITVYANSPGGSATACMGPFPFKDSLHLIPVVCQTHSLVQDCFS